MTRRPSIATPCPLPPPSDRLSSLPLLRAGGERRASVAAALDLGNDTLTREIEFTRALQQEAFKSARPRRRSDFSRKAGAAPPAVAIFEDVIEEEEQEEEEGPVPARREVRGQTLLGRPAQKRTARRPPGVVPRSERPGETAPVPQRGALGQARRRSSVALYAVGEERMDGDEKMEFGGRRVGKEDGKSVVGEGLKTNNPRRRTIFVPSDDTTVLTIHPGANTTRDLNDTFHMPAQFAPQIAQVQSSVGLVEEQNASKHGRRPRMSLAGAPRRAPLRQLRENDGNILASDVPGQNGGKENVPPALEPYHPPGKKVKIEKSANIVSTSFSGRQSTFLESNASSSQARGSATAQSSAPLTKNHHDARRSVVGQQHEQRTSDVSKPKPRAKTTSPQSTSGVIAQSVSQGAASIGLKHTTRGKSPPSRLQDYPLLSEDLAQTDLYDDNWLSHQEVSLSEVVNQIFADADAGRELDEGRCLKSLRERMIDIYHQPQTTALYKRLQASLDFGALSRPKDSSNPPSPASDIGLRKRYLGLWLESYHEQAILTAAEVVFGRQLLLSKAHRTTLGSVVSHSERLLDPNQNKRALTGFLQTFLVECDDVERLDTGSPSDPYDFENRRWRKMVLRSLMLIWLLDQAKKSKLVDKCLFLQSSSRKSSLAMLHALTALVIPSIGDLTKTLKHLSYEVSHTQDPLDEVHYHIDNIAVDLRDGIFLTRLVELLLFHPRLRRGTHQTDQDATVTVQLPGLTILESMRCDSEDLLCPRILSQHLKMPCSGRAQKLHNVGIALSTVLARGQLAADVASDITCDDIVDGHREKTLSLVWLLVSTYALDKLVNWEYLAADIKRVALEPQKYNDSDLSTMSKNQQESKLKAWASAHCSRHGLRISNLTTSFADGSAYAAIIADFSNHLCASTDRKTSAETQLRALGCSVAFSRQLVSATGTIPSRRTTISNLAFLASRLLPLVRRCSAATTIQRAWRAMQCRSNISRRLILVRIAHACATVVQTQNKLVQAATVLQKAWRRVLDDRIARWNGDVEKFQCLARAWAARKQNTQLAYGFKSGFGGPSQRSMGGW